MTHKPFHSCSFSLKCHRDGGLRKLADTVRRTGVIRRSTMEEFLRFLFLILGIKYNTLYDGLKGMIFVYFIGRNTDVSYCYDSDGM